MPPLEIWGESNAIDAIVTGIWPAIASVSSGPPPRYGTWVIVTFSPLAMLVMARCARLPAPTVP